MRHVFRTLAVAASLAALAVLAAPPRESCAQSSRFT